jgi:tRNA1Val (adenine37-N6)-methyltransferase
MDAVLVRQDETLDDLFRGKIRILQKRSGYRLAMDPILLAHFASPLRGGRVIDLGTGSGVIPMILTLRGEAGEVIGLEVQPDLVDMARRTVEINGLAERVKILQGDYRHLEGLFPAQSFQHVVCNPPYHPKGKGRPSPHSVRSYARHEVSGSLEEAVQAARYLLNNKGRLWLTYSPARLSHLFIVLGQGGLEPKRLRMVHGRGEMPARMVLIEAVRGGRQGLEVLPPLIMYRRGSVYTEELEEIYHMI